MVCLLGSKEDSDRLDPFGGSGGRDGEIVVARVRQFDGSTIGNLHHPFQGIDAARGGQDEPMQLLGV